MEVKRVDCESKEAATEFSTSLKETGFAVLYNHPICLTLVEEVYQEWQDFFASPQKAQYLFNRDSQDGFFPQTVSEIAKDANIKDIKEFFQFYPWGQFPDFLSNKTKLLHSKLEELATTLLNWIESYLPKSLSNELSMPLSEMIKGSKKNMLRILHYPPLLGSEPEGAVRAAEHGDIDLLTLLVGATDSGLQAKDSEGKWHNIPIDRNSIAVNAGDMLEMCTQYFYRSTRHRVVNPVGHNNARLSMPLFLHPRPEVLLKKGFTAEDYLTERLKELGTF